MKYTKFIIKNFKGIKNLSLDLSLSPNLSIFTLVGLNESGKTTVLEAVDFFHKGIDSAKSHTLIPKSKKINFNDSVSVQAHLTLSSDDEAKIKEFSKTLGFLITEDIKVISIDKRFTFESSKYKDDNSFWTIKIIGKKKKSKVIKSIDASNDEWQKIVAYIRSNLIPKIIYYPNFLFDFPNKIYLQEKANETQEQGFYRQVLQDILDSLNEGLQLESHILDRMDSKDEEDKEALTSTLNKVGSKITHTVFKSWETLFKANGKNKEIVLIPGFDTKRNPEGIETQQHYLELKLKEGSEQYQISERSLGFRWFFVFLLFTEFRKNRAEDPGEILFLLDEPASNLHSAAQTKLVEILKGLVDKSKLIYTTHSHHLINPEWLEGAYIVQNKSLDYENELEYDTSKTDIVADLYRVFVAKSPNQQTYFQPILDSLEYKPSKIELVPEIIIVEGKNDFYTFKYINDVILKNQFKDLKFYPGNGAGKNEQIIKLYISWGRKYLTLMDSDSAGDAGKKKYTEDIGKIVEGHIFTLKDISPSLKNASTEDIFTAAERLKIIQAFEPSVKQYSKAKFNNAIQNLLFFKNEVALNEGTKKKFIDLFTKLSDQLSKIN